MTDSCISLGDAHVSIIKFAENLSPFYVDSPVDKSFDVALVR